ncbi:hypothetical protein [Synechococcus sp. R55.7]|jgi:hypothetical protein|uniref:hypothetical protein n=1 Tax=Synechococcus sp. R55.7 TaxID=2964500 RepID=UPI0039C16C33
MLSIPDYERRDIQVPLSCIPVAARALIRQGVSVCWREESLSALIRLGSKGAADRAAILLVEMSLMGQPEELKSWLEMCWQLPACLREPLQV